MKALLCKDFRVMWKQMKAFLLLIAIFCLIPNQALNLSSFFVVYAGLMLPMSLMSYDERAKRDTFAALLPGWTVRTELLWGSPGPEIVYYARERGFDALVMTRSSRGPLQKLGSVATYVVRNAQFLDLIIMREAAP